MMHGSTNIKLTQMLRRYKRKVDKHLNGFIFFGSYPSVTVSNVQDNGLGQLH